MVMALFERPREFLFMFQNRPNYSYIYASRGFSATAELFVSETDVSPYSAGITDWRLLN